MKAPQAGPARRHERRQRQHRGRGLDLHFQRDRGEPEASLQLREDVAEHAHLRRCAHLRQGDHQAGRGGGAAVRGERGQEEVQAAQPAGPHGRVQRLGAQPVGRREPARGGGRAQRLGRGDGDGVLLGVGADAVPVLEIHPEVGNR